MSLNFVLFNQIFLHKNIKLKKYEMTIFEVDLFKDKLSEECMPSNMADEEEDPVVHEVRLIFCCFKCIKLT